MKKNDFRLIGIILLAAILVLVYQYSKKETTNGTAVITVAGKLFGRFPLSEDQDIDVNGTNTLEISAGKARMLQADCPDKLCVQQKAISRDGESIICLPNKVVITVEGGAPRKLDAITN